MDAWIKETMKEQPLVDVGTLKSVLTASDKWLQDLKRPEVPKEKFLARYTGGGKFDSQIEEYGVERGGYEVIRVTDYYAVILLGRVGTGRASFLMADERAVADFLESFAVTRSGQWLHGRPADGELQFQEGEFRLAEDVRVGTVRQGDMALVRFAKDESDAMTFELPSLIKEFWFEVRPAPRFFEMWRQ